MSADPEIRYPGQSASAEKHLRLAEVYRKAADVFLTPERKSDPLSAAPYRLAAIHSIELYLNALLLHFGHRHPQIRGLQHDLSKRTKQAFDHGLRLRQKTAKHLSAMTESREYLVVRYDPDMPVATPHLDKLAATLKEVAKKVTELTKKAPQMHAAF